MPFLTIFHILTLITILGNNQDHLTLNNMSDNFNILSLNVNDNIKNSDHRGKLLACTRLYNIHILLLQETHVSSLRYKEEIDREFDCESFWSFGSTDSRGVAVLLMNKFERKIFLNFKKTFTEELFLLKFLPI